MEPLCFKIIVCAGRGFNAIPLSKKNPSSLVAYNTVETSDFPTSHLSSSVLIPI
jgi:hypothetical protein